MEERFKSIKHVILVLSGKGSLLGSRSLSSLRFPSP